MSTTTPITRIVTRTGGDVRMVRACVGAVMSGGAAGAAVSVHKPRFRIGSHPSNDLVLPDSTVSKYHVELTMTPEGYLVTDLDSSNGTWLGAMRIGSVTIVEPVQLLLGTTTVRLTPTSDEVEVPASTQPRFGSVVGQSLVMRELFAELEAAAPTDCWLLLEGETGVGKERVAESVHRHSPRVQGPFVVLDCAALVGNLMESELFGHVRGAFSGAERERQGLLEQANGGTLFLDEVGELPLPLQTRLLGALGRQMVTPVGSHKPRPIDVRVLAATHRDLAREVKEGRFRADLFYRLAVVRVRIPPLRERLEDLPLLVETFLAELRQRHGETVPQALSAVALTHLAAEHWPGNVRELRNAVERAVSVQTATVPDLTRAERPFAEAREQFSIEIGRKYLSEVLEQSGWNVSEAARRAGVERRNFIRLLERHHVAPLRPKRQRP